MENQRRQIDALDEEITRLVQQRAELAHQIGALKAETASPAYDPAREAEVLRRIGQTPGLLPPAALQAIFTEIVSACRAVEEPLHVAYLGPPHTFSHLAACKRFGSQARFTPAPSIPDIFRLVEAGQCQTGLVPVENSTGGVVPETLDCLLETELKICAEVHLPVHLSLLATCSLEEVRTLYSHPQPLAQCRQWIREHLPTAELHVVSSTIAAAGAAAAQTCAAALAPADAASEYGLQILAENIEDVPSNRTRFFVISPTDARPTGADKTSLVFATAHRPGALHETLGAFARHDLNLTLIQSRPMRGQLWQYGFFVDFEGHREDEPVRQALEELRRLCSLLKVLGSYPAEEG